METCSNQSQSDTSSHLIFDITKSLSTFAFRPSQKMRYVEVFCSSCCVFDEYCKKKSCAGVSQKIPFFNNDSDVVSATQSSSLACIHSFVAIRR